MKLVFKTADWDDTAQDHNALATESKFLSCDISTEFNRPARATVILYDTDGSTAQKYDVDAAGDSVYVGPGRAYIYDDDDAGDASVFDGRIVSATSNMNEHTLTLECEDWLSQLDDDRIDYDMREDLDGGGLRQSGLKSDTDGDETTSRSPTYTSGADYYMYDDDMDWSFDEWNGYYVALPVDHVGDQEVTVGPFACTSATPDTVTGDVDDLWVADGTNVMYATKAGAGNNTFSLTYELRTIVNEGSLGTKFTKMTCTLVYLIESGSGDGDLYIGDATIPSYKLIAEPTLTAAGEPYRVLTVEIPPELITTSQDFDDGIIRFRVAPAGVGGITATIYIDQLTVTGYFTVASGHSSLITIEDTDRTEAEALSKAYMYEDGVGYTDETVDINDDGAGDVQLLPNPLSQNDGFYFGATSQFEGLKLTISQAGDYTGTGYWTYWDGDSWDGLPSISDGTDYFETAGTNDVTWALPSDWEQTAVNGETKYWVRMTISTAIPAIAVTPLATQGWAYTGSGNRLEVNTDLSITGLGLWEECQYSICKEIYKHIDTGESGTLITDGDTIYDLTAAANIEHTSGVSLRHYTERTRLEILQDLCSHDKSVFWIPLGTAALTWKSTFNDGAPTAMTDASVLTWTLGRWDWKSVYNEYHVYGARIGDVQINEEDHDTTSLSTYGIYRTKVLSGTGLITEYDAAQLADKLVARDKDCQLYLQAEIGGLSSLRLGDEVSITSSYLGLSAVKYVVTHWNYNSPSYRTQIRLYPRTAASTIGFQESYDFTEVRSVEQIRRTSDSDRYIAGLTTQTW